MCKEALDVPVDKTKIKAIINSIILYATKCFTIVNMILTFTIKEHIAIAMHTSLFELVSVVKVA